MSFNTDNFGSYQTCSDPTGTSSDPYRTSLDPIRPVWVLQALCPPATDPGQGAYCTSEGRDILLTFFLFQKDKSGHGTVLGTWTGSSEGSLSLHVPFPLSFCQECSKIVINKGVRTVRYRYSLSTPHSINWLPVGSGQTTLPHKPFGGLTRCCFICLRLSQTYKMERKTTFRIMRKIFVIFARAFAIPYL